MTYVLYTYKDKLKSTIAQVPNVVFAAFRKYIKVLLVVTIATVLIILFNGPRFILIAPNIAPFVQSVISGMTLGMYVPTGNEFIGIFNPQDAIVWIYLFFLIFTVYFIYDLDVVKKEDSIKDSKIFSVLYTAGYYVPTILLAYFLMIVAGGNDGNAKVKLSIISALFTFGLLTILVFVRVEFLSQYNLTQYTDPIVAKIKASLANIKSSTNSMPNTVSVSVEKQVEEEALVTDIESQDTQTASQDSESESDGLVTDSSEEN